MIISRYFYLVIFIILQYGWPFLLIDTISRNWIILLIISNTALAIFVYKYTTSLHISFYYGINLICGSLMSGCANITIIYIFPLLALIYLLQILCSLLGILWGRRYTQDRWIKTVYYFDRGRNFTRIIQDRSLQFGQVPDWLGNSNSNGKDSSQQNNK